MKMDGINLLLATRIMESVLELAMSEIDDEAGENMPTSFNPHLQDTLERECNERAIDRIAKAGLYNLIKGYDTEEIDTAFSQFIRYNTCYTNEADMAKELEQ